MEKELLEEMERARREIAAYTAAGETGLGVVQGHIDRAQARENMAQKLLKKLREGTTT